MATKRKMPGRPLAGRVVVKRDEPEGATKGGIVLPDKAKQVQRTGVVVAVPPIPVREDGTAGPVGQVEVGDRVLFAAYGGMEVTVDGVAYTVIREEDIAMVLAEGATVEETQG